ncbi:MAG: MptD family putative ECF transporter S component [Olsenella uli]|uniref:MptD family putative ECF transporter S component n=1 Tax=Olsenella uli TaxID=133926 RepID=UPI001D9BECCA|nr:MptD family putative ECF transporter S component [Olsenella uli]MBS6417790.1 MptD family putative ECF transporter S component [Olsenella uli]
MESRQVVESGESKRLTMKDIITLVIFNVAILIVMVVVKMLITLLATPAFNYLAYVGVMALFCAPLFVVMSNRVAKTGVYFVTALLAGLMMAAFGSAWFLAVMVAVGVICEVAMAGKDSYRSPMRNGIGYAVYWALYALGSAIPLFFFKEQYLASLQGSYTQEGIDVLLSFYGSPNMLALITLITVVLSAVGFMAGNALYRRHIKKAKLA